MNRTTFIQFLPTQTTSNISMETVKTPQEKTVTHFVDTILKFLNKCVCSKIKCHDYFLQQKKNFCHSFKHFVTNFKISIYNAIDLAEIVSIFEYLSIMLSFFRLNKDTHPRRNFQFFFLNDNKQSYVVTKLEIIYRHKIRYPLQLIFFTFFILFQILANYTSLRGKK